MRRLRGWKRINEVGFNFSILRVGCFAFRYGKCHKAGLLYLMFLLYHSFVIASGIIPTKDAILRFNPDFDPACPLCGESPQTSVHIFIHCQAARALWFGSNWGFNPHELNLTSTWQLIDLLLFPNSTVIPSDIERQAFLLCRSLTLECILEIKEFGSFWESWDEHPEVSMADKK